MKLSKMSLIAALSTLVPGAAFTSRSAFPRVAKAVTARAMSSADGPFPFGDDKMPFYALGVNLAKQVGGQTGFKSLLNDDELDLVLKGFSEEITGTSTVDANTVLMKFGMELNKILQERSSNIMERVRQEGEEFMAGFMDCNDDAIKTESGMIYYSMKEGTGASPTLQDTVEVHYHGTLVDGTVFDSSVERGQTISFPLGGVIKGWQEGLQLMKEGGKATLVIPSDLAYGDAGSGDVIPPGATLKFEVELFKVN